MKKISSTVVLVVRTDLSAQGASRKKKAFNKETVDVDAEMPSYRPVETNAHSLKNTRRFKIALISSYTFLISLFGTIVYIAIVLDPKFPF